MDLAPSCIHSHHHTPEWTSCRRISCSRYHIVYTMLEVLVQASIQYTSFLHFVFLVSAVPSCMLCSSVCCLQTCFPADCLTVSVIVVFSQTDSSVVEYSDSIQLYPLVSLFLSVDVCIPGGHNGCF